MIFLVGLLKSYGLPLVPSNFDFSNYTNILFNNKMVRDGVSNSLILAVSSGIFAMLLGVMIAYVIIKIKPKGKGALEFLLHFHTLYQVQYLQSVSFLHGLVRS